jgi:hypothetical protein
VTGEVFHIKNATIAALPSPEILMTKKTLDFTINQKNTFLILIPARVL